MKLFGKTLLFILVFGIYSCSNSSKFSNRIQSLNGTWDIAESASPDAMPDTFPSTIQVPSFIDMAVPAFKKLDYPNDTNRYFWYKKQFAIDHADYDVVELELRKAKYSALVLLNGKTVGQQNIAYSSAKFNIKDFLNADGEPNDLVIRVGTRENFPDTLICGADFEKKTFFAGIFDDVNLLLKNAPYIEMVQIAPDIDNDLVKAFVEVNRLTNTEPFTLNYEIIDYKTKEVVLNGSQQIDDTSAELEVALEIPFKDYTLWSPKTPHLYELKLSTGADEETTRFGMRSFTIDNVNKQFMLNNKPFYPLGTNIAMYRFFEDSLRGSHPWDEQWIRKLYSRFKDMNWNSFRFHVGPAPDLWYDIADEMGFLVQDEYSIWYGKGGVHSLDPRITPEQLAVEYKHWMRDRWNHPSIVIWDAQNETVSRITGPALEMVRSLDHSNRPWDNGYTRPTRETDMIESHPYLLYTFHMKGAKVPEEGIMKHLFGEVRMPYNDPNEQDPSEDGKIYENVVLLNEYAWLWLNRDGSPTTLSGGVYNLLYKDADTPEKRFKAYSRMLAAMTEYWRAHRKVAGIHHFAGLTYSRPHEPKGQTSDCFKDLESLEFHEDMLKYVKPAFSEVALMAEAWEKEYKKGQDFELPVYVINDSQEPWKGIVTIGIFSGEEAVNSWEFESDVENNTVDLEKIDITIPETQGIYELRVSLDYNGQKITSYRDLDVK